MDKFFVVLEFLDKIPECFGENSILLFRNHMEMDEFFESLNYKVCDNSTHLVDNQSGNTFSCELKWGKQPQTL